MNKNIIKLDFTNSQIDQLVKIKDQPPKKITVNKKLMNIMWEYSAKKNRAKDIEEYSTL
jgi:hypothetical protein